MELLKHVGKNSKYALSDAAIVRQCLAGRIPIKALCDLIEDEAKPGMVVCEVGCWDGRTTACYLPIVEREGGRVIVVDWFEGTEGQSATEFQGHDPSKADKVYGEFRANVPNYAAVKVLMGRSLSMAEQIDDASLDICFIDANHRYADVKADIGAWEPKVKKTKDVCPLCKQNAMYYRYDNDEFGKYRCSRCQWIGLKSERIIERGGLICGHDCEKLPPPRQFTEQELETNYVDGMHCGVIQAVWERYGQRSEVRLDYGIYGTPIWVVRL